jgi:cysteine-rich repeat protein
MLWFFVFLHVFVYYMNMYSNKEVVIELIWHIEEQWRAITPGIFVAHIVALFGLVGLGVQLFAPDIDTIFFTQSESDISTKEDDILVVDEQVLPSDAELVDKATDIWVWAIWNEQDSSSNTAPISITDTLEKPTGNVWTYIYYIKYRTTATLDRSFLPEKTLTESPESLVLELESKKELIREQVGVSVAMQHQWFSTQSVDAIQQWLQDTTNPISTLELVQEMVETYEIQEVANIFDAYDRTSDEVSNTYRIVSQYPFDEATLKSIDPFIEYIEQPAPMMIFSMPNDPRFTEQWYMQDSTTAINASGAWNLLWPATAAVKVAVIDSRFDFAHPEMLGVLSKENTTLDSWDTDYHGQHVTGIIWAKRNNTEWIAGVASDYVSILWYWGIGTSFDWIGALNDATNKWAKVVNLSFGCCAQNPNLNNWVCIPEDMTLDQYNNICFTDTDKAAMLQVYNRWVTIVAAAWNDEVAYASYPAWYEGVIAVCSIDQNWQKSSFSQHGSNVDICAPWRDILSTVSIAMNGWYASYPGTSMASPVVAGTVALMLAADPSLSPSDIQSKLLSSAKQTWAPHPTVDACRAVAIAQNKNPDQVCGASTVPWTGTGYNCTNNQCLQATSWTWQYATLETCKTSCITASPPWTGTGYNCTNNQCVQVTSWIWQFLTVASCKEKCELQDSAPIKRYACVAWACKEDASWPFTTPTCNNTCQPSWSWSTASCSYICLTPSTLTASPQFASMSAAQVCTIPWTNSAQCGGATCGGVCEDGNKRCVDDSQCNGLKCRTRDQSRDKPCGGIPKYKCTAGACIRDDTFGTMTHPNCNNQCIGWPGYECLWSVPSNAIDCKDGPLPNSASTSYKGNKFCSPLISCDRKCADGFVLQNNRCIDPTKPIDPNNPDQWTGDHNAPDIWPKPWNGVVESWETCDDGNLIAADGCSPAMKIEPGWRCTAWSPSQCGTIDCIPHGGSFSSRNISGTCCNPLSSLKADFNTTIQTWTGTLPTFHTICYDPEIDTPVCLKWTSKQEWRYVQRTPQSGYELILPWICVTAFKDYFQELSEFIKGQHDFCAYDDEAYEYINFQDIQKSRDYQTILALQHACIVKWRWTSMRTFAPDSRPSRAEFIKTLVKTMYMGEMSFDETVTVEDDFVTTPYMDVSGSQRYYQYIAHAHAEKLLIPIVREQYLKMFFYPNRSITSDEIADTLLTIYDGTDLSRSAILEILWNTKYPTRWTLASLMVSKFPDRFQDYFYRQWAHLDYYKELLWHLRGKTYTEQYAIILDQMTKLSDLQQSHGSSDSRMHYEWIKRYLQELVRP